MHEERHIAILKFLDCAKKWMKLAEHNFQDELSRTSSRSLGRSRSSRIMRKSIKCHKLSASRKEEEKIDDLRAEKELLQRKVAPQLQEEQLDWTPS